VDIVALGKFLIASGAMVKTAEDDPQTFVTCYNHARCDTNCGAVRPAKTTCFTRVQKLITTGSASGGFFYQGQLSAMRRLVEPVFSQTDL
jgi:hypothetical protein